MLLFMLPLSFVLGCLSLSCNLITLGRERSVCQGGRAESAVEASAYTSTLDLCQLYSPIIVLFQEEALEDGAQARAGG